MRRRMETARTRNLTGNLAHTRKATELALTSQSSRDGTGFLADGSYELAGWALTSRYNQNHNVSRFPQRDTTGGYAERGTYRSIEGTVTRNLWQRVTAKASGGVTLASYRYSLIGGYTNPPVPRDQYHQFYRLEGIYSQPTGFSTGVALEVVRDLFVNIPSASTAANTETRSYRAEWRWSYQLLSGLTATQRNTLGADYALYPFLPSNNRLSLDYNTLTTLNAVITPRLRLDMTHNARRQPSGNYSNLPDGLPYFSRSDEGVNYTLSTQISYSPTPPCRSIC